MKCRKVIKNLDNDTFDIVYFGSIGTINPYAVFFKLNLNTALPVTYRKTEQGIITNNNGTILTYDSDNISLTIENINMFSAEENVGELTYSLTINYAAEYNKVKIPTLDYLQFYYEKSGDNYIRTTDIEVNPAKTYYLNKSEFSSLTICYYSEDLYNK